MKFQLEDDQQALADSVQRYLRQEYAFEQRKTLLSRAPQDFDRRHWRRFADMGWLGVASPSQYGGLGEDLASAMPIMEAFGAHLVMEPYVGSVLECATVLGAAASAAQLDRWLPGIASGEHLVAFAHAEPDMRYEWAAVQTCAQPSDGGFVLQGRKTAVPYGASADRWIVSARTSGAPGSAEGISLWWVDPTLPGIGIQTYRAVDDTPLADLSFDGVPLPDSARIGPLGQAFPAIEDALAVSLAASCVEAVGAMTALHALTLDYAKIRTQFGGPISRFQVLQHRLVDMLTHIELARSLAWLAVAKAQDRSQRRLVLSAAKAQVSASCRLVAEHAIQIHGGIGMTDELSASHYFKRLMALEKRSGDRHFHLGVLTEAVAQGHPSLYG